MSRMEEPGHPPLTLYIITQGQEVLQSHWFERPGRMAKSID